MLSRGELERKGDRCSLILHSFFLYWESLVLGVYGVWVIFSTYRISLIRVYKEFLHLPLYRDRELMSAGRVLCHHLNIQDLGHIEEFPFLLGEVHGHHWALTWPFTAPEIPST